MSVSVKPTRCAPPRPRPGAVGGSCASRDADRGCVLVRDGRAADVHDAAPARRIRSAALAFSTTSPSSCGLVSLDTASPASCELVVPVRHPVSSRPSVINRASTTCQAKWIKNTGRVASTVSGTGSADPRCRVERIRVLRPRRRHEARFSNPTVVYGSCACRTVIRRFPLSPNGPGTVIATDYKRAASRFYAKAMSTQRSRSPRIYGSPPARPPSASASSADSPCGSPRWLFGLAIPEPSETARQGPHRHGATDGIR